MQRLCCALLLLSLCCLIGCQQSDPVRYYRNGNADYAQGHDEEAIAEFSKAIKLNPNYINAYINRGTAFCRNGRYYDAIVDFDHVMQKEPNNARALANLAAQYHLQQYGAALIHTRRALELDSKLTYARFNLGLIYATEENWDAAQREYARALLYGDQNTVNASIEQLQMALIASPQSVALKKALHLLQNFPSR